MENFDFKKYLAEGILLSEGILEDFVADIAKLKEPGSDEFDLDARGYLKNGKVTVYLDSDFKMVIKAINSLVKNKYADTIKKVKEGEDTLVYTLK
jgi:hypothetical protein